MTPITERTIFSITATIFYNKFGTLTFDFYRELIETDGLYAYI